MVGQEWSGEAKLATLEARAGRALEGAVGLQLCILGEQRWMLASWRERTGRVDMTTEHALYEDTDTRHSMATFLQRKRMRLLLQAWMEVALEANAPVNRDNCGKLDK